MPHSYTARVASEEGIEHDATPPPYRFLAPLALIIKALLQMIIGAFAVYVLIKHIWPLPSDRVAIRATQELVFSYIGLALGLAAAIELAYTLFTHGPDEALDPLMLGVAAALLLQLGQVDKFDYREGIATLLYVAALAGLFAIRKRLAEKVRVGNLSHLIDLFRRRPKRSNARPKRELSRDLRVFSQNRLSDRPAPANSDDRNEASPRPQE
jgi:hypothetical protein